MRIRAAFVGITLLTLGFFLTGCFFLQPQAEVDFIASTVDGPQPLVVLFTPALEETAVSFAWDFGDGNTSDEPDPVHVYKAAGTFTVSLTVELADGREATEIKIDHVTVNTSLQNSSTGLLYWTNDRGRLKSGGRDGSGETLIAEWFFSVRGMEIANDKLFWLDTSQKISGVSLNDNAKWVEETLVHGREMYYLPWDMAVDQVRGKVYWTCRPYTESVEDAGDTDWMWTGGIYRANLDGSSIETLVTYPAGASEYATEIASLSTPSSACCQMRPVALSVTVPLPLFTKARMSPYAPPRTQRV